MQVLKASEPGVWHRTSPFAILFFIGRILRLVAKNAWQSLAPLFALLIAYQGDLVSTATLGGIALAAVLTTASILSYWFFRYQVLPDSILIRQGVVKKKQTDIKFDRIQGINTEQNPVYRLLGLVTVTFDTAGSAGDEGKLPAVTRAFADALRTRVAERRGTAHADIPQDSAPPNTLLSLDWRDMVRIGLADRRALLVFAIIGPLLERLGDDAERIIANSIERAADDAFQFGVASGVLIITIAMTGLLVLLALISIFAAFLRFHNFELWLEGSSLRSQGGLLTRHEHAMDLGKIQTLSLRQGIVQRWQKRLRMTAHQALSSGRQRNQKVFVVPSVTAAQADHLRRSFLAPEAGVLSQDPGSAAFRPVSPLYMRSRILFVGLLPALAAVALSWQSLGNISLWSLLWVPLVATVAYRNWQCAGFMHDDQEIIRRSGLIGYRTVGLLFRKVQRVSVLQSRYQRRKGLASLRMYMASGSVRIPYIEHGMAKQLRDYILYKVESSDKAWH